MTLSIAKIITLILAAMMLLLVFSPMGISTFYLLFRPLVQPFSIKKYVLVGTIPLNTLFSIILILSAYLTAIFQRTATLRHPRIIPLYILMYFAIVTLFFTPSYAESIAQILKLLSAIGMYMLIFNAIQTKSDSCKILWAYLMGSIIPMLFGYYQYVAGTGRAWQGEFYVSRRIDSFLGFCNEYGMFLSITLVAALMLLLQETSRIRRLVIIGMIVSLTASEILALNRGTWISFTLGLIVATMLYHDKIKIRWIVIAGICIGITFGDMVYERFTALHQLSAAGRTQDTLQGRMEAWRILIPVILEKPILGHGFGAVTEITEQKLNMPIAPHNDYIRLGVEIGMVGLLCYGFFLLYELYRCLKNVPRKDIWDVNFPLLIMLVYYPIISVVQNIMQSTTVFPMFLGLVGLSHKIDNLSREGKLR